MAREKTTAVPKFDKISIGLASPESILAVLLAGAGRAGAGCIQSLSYDPVVIRQSRQQVISRHITYVDAERCQRYNRSFVLCIFFPGL